MQSSYQSIENHDKSFDLDENIDVIGGFSTKREGWTGLISYIPEQRIFI